MNPIPNKKSVVANGLITGLILQLAIGPVFFFIANLVLQRSIYDGFVVISAIILVDGLFRTFKAYRK